MPQKSGRARVGTQLHIRNPRELVGFWAMNKLKVNWDNDTCKLIMRCVIKKVTTMTYIL